MTKVGPRFHTEGMEILRAALAKVIRNRLSRLRLSDVVVRMKIPENQVRMQLMYRPAKRGITVASLHMIAYGLGVKASVLLAEAETLASEEFQLRKVGREFAKQLKAGVSIEPPDSSET